MGVDSIVVAAPIYALLLSLVVAEAGATDEGGRCTAVQQRLLKLRAEIQEVEQEAEAACAAGVPTDVPHLYTPLRPSDIGPGDNNRGAITGGATHARGMLQGGKQSAWRRRSSGQSADASDPPQSSTPCTVAELRSVEDANDPAVVVVGLLTSAPTCARCLMRCASVGAQTEQVACGRACGPSGETAAVPAEQLIVAPDSTSPTPDPARPCSKSDIYAVVNAGKEEGANVIAGLMSTNLECALCLIQALTQPMPDGIMLAWACHHQDENRCDEATGLSRILPFLERATLSHRDTIVVLMTAVEAGRTFRLASLVSVSLGTSA
jgi:hypothetical protein